MRSASITRPRQANTPKSAANRMNGSPASAAPKLWTAPFIKICLINLLIFVAFHMLMATFAYYVIDVGGTEVTAGLIAATRERGNAVWAVGTTVPTPAVLADKTSATGAEGVVLTLALGDGRRVVNIRLAHLCLHGAT